MAEANSPEADEAPEVLEKALDEIDYTGRQLRPGLAVLIGAIAALWSLFQLWIASPLPFIFDFGIIVDVPVRGIHLAFGLLLCFLMFPAARRLASDTIPIYDVILALVGAGCALYLFLGYEGLVSRQGILLAFDVSLFGVDFSFPFEAVLGGIGIVLLLEATRRSIGLPLVVVACVFLVYSVFGQSMPDIISHKGLSLTRLIGYHWLGGEAIFGIPIDVSVSFVFLFVLFGALLDKAGASKYFLDLSFAMVGRYRGGPAKAAILASGMTDKSIPHISTAVLPRSQGRRITRQLGTVLDLRRHENGAGYWYRSLSNCFITAAELNLLLPRPLIKRLVNHARHNDITKGTIRIVPSGNCWSQLNESQAVSRN